MTFRPPVHLLAPLALVLPAVAQTSGNPDGFTITDPTWGSVSITAYFGKTEAGDFDQSHLPSLAVMDGEAGNPLRDIKVMWNPGRKIATSTAFTGAYDMAVLPGSAGAADRIAVLSPNGLDLIEVVDDPVQQMGAEYIARIFQATPILTTPMAPGSRIHVADMDFNGFEDIVVSNPTGNSIEVLLQFPNGSFALMPMSGATAFPVLDMVAYDADGSGAYRELALVSQNGVQVIGVGGNLLIDSTHPAITSQFATRVTSAATGTEWVAQIVEIGGTQKLYRVDQGVPTHIADLNLGTEVLNVCSGDINGDDNDDLAFNLTGTHEVGLLYHQGTATPVFDPDSTDATKLVIRAIPSLPLGSGDSNSNNEAQPVLADLDGDGDLDLGVGIEPYVSDPAQEKLFYVWRNPLEDQVELAPSAYLESSGDNKPLEWDLTDPATTNLRVWIAPPAALLPTNEADYLEVAIYEKPDLNSPLGAAPVSYPQYQKLDGSAYYEFEFDLEFTGPSVDRVWFYLARWVSIDESTGELTDVGPSTNFAFAPIDTDEPADDDVESFLLAFAEVSELSLRYLKVFPQQENSPPALPGLDPIDDGGVPVECTGGHDDDIPPRPPVPPVPPVDGNGN